MTAPPDRGAAPGSLRKAGLQGARRVSCRGPRHPLARPRRTRHPFGVSSAGGTRPDHRLHDSRRTGRDGSAGRDTVALGETAAPLPAAGPLDVARVARAGPLAPDRRRCHRLRRSESCGRGHSRGHAPGGCRRGRPGPGTREIRVSRRPVPSRPPRPPPLAAAFRTPPLRRPGGRSSQTAGDGAGVRRPGMERRQSRPGNLPATREEGRGTDR